METQSSRIKALFSFANLGPSYDRNVVEPLRDAIDMVDRGRTDEAEYWLRMAEMRAGVITFEEYEAWIATQKGEAACPH